MDNNERRSSSFWVPQDITNSTRNWLLAIALIGLTIRLLAAYLQPACLDEGLYYYSSKVELPNIIQLVKYDRHTPLLCLSHHPISQLTTDIFWLRLPGIILSIGTILLSFQIARRFFCDRISLVLCGFFAISYQTWMSDMNFHAYPSMEFFLALVWLGTLDIIEQRRPFFNTIKSPSLAWTIFVIACLGTAGFHAIGVMVLTACALTVFLQKHPKRWQLACLYGVCSLPCIVWFIWCHLNIPNTPVAPHLDFGQNGICSVFFSPLYLFDIEFQKYLEYLESPTLNFLHYPLFFVSIAVGALLWWRWLRGWKSLHNDMPQQAMLLAVGLWTPLVIMAIANILGKLCAQALYMTVTAICFLIPFFYGLSQTQLKRLFGILIIPSLVLTAFSPFNHTIWKQYWQGAIDFIEKDRRPSDVVALYIPYTIFSFSLAYDPLNMEISYDPQCQFRFTQHPSDKAQILPLSDSMIGSDVLDSLQNRRVILVLYKMDKEKQQRVAEWINRDYQVVDAYRYTDFSFWSDMDVYKLERIIK